MSDWTSQVDMAHAFAPDTALSHFDTAFVTNNPTIANSFILAAVTLPVFGRAKAFEAIVKSLDIPEATIPESFRVLVKELNSLCLNIIPMGVIEADVLKDDEEDDKEEKKEIIMEKQNE